VARVFRGSSDPHIGLLREGKILLRGLPCGETLRGPANAALQIPRVAKARGLSEERVR
jgi:hypothetical protein